MIVSENADCKGRREVISAYPDTGDAGDPETIRKVNAAHRMVSDYVSEYRFSFAEEEFYEQNPEERIRRQFAYDPLWGRG